ncbi:uncharacterized protein LOC127792042 [Diospyros lotus]|uniref:uncharacterized protein LOC127792042 n=1 Tax=Diospyros lotus TaxID=55363 RepID=UPI002250454E|nr:uncharacterized protein LOC127792042 [Diospyros lotus]
MGVKKVGTVCLQFPQPSVRQPSSSPQNLPSKIPSISRRRSRCGDGGLVIRHDQRLDRSAFFGTQLYRTRSCELPKSRTKTKTKTIRRACSASLDAFFDEEFTEKIRELAMKFDLSNDDDEISDDATEPEIVSDLTSSCRRPFDPVEPQDWTARAEIIPADIERKANSVDLPFSLRILKKKKQGQEGVRQAGESACSSVQKAFSSMVFIIREIHSFTLQMREMLSCEDLRGILVRVQKEIHASFVWLFQRVFSHTPTLMVYVMILLANYSVYSMANNPAMAAQPPQQPYAAATESVSLLEDQNHKNQKFDASSIKTYSLSSSTGKSTSVGGNNGGGGKSRPIASGTDGDGRFDHSASLNYHRTEAADGAASGGNAITEEDESVSGQAAREEELRLWNSIVEEAAKMQAESRDLALDHETMHRFVSPVTSKIDADDYADYFRTELSYRTCLAQDPDNTLLLANYAQFLYLVARDYDRAEEYFKRAAKAETPDAEALSKYAAFLWQAKNDLWAAEETYLEAISADPSNSYYAANYANFLWNTGGEDTCFPIDDDGGANDDA